MSRNQHGSVPNQPNHALPKKIHKQVWLPKKSSNYGESPLVLEQQGPISPIFGWEN